MATDDYTRAIPLIRIIRIYNARERANLSLANLTEKKLHNTENRKTCVKVFLFFVGSLASYHIIELFGEIALNVDGTVKKICLSDTKCPQNSTHNTNFYSGARDKWELNKKKNVIDIGVVCLPRCVAMITLSNIKRYFCVLV